MKKICLEKQLICRAKKSKHIILYGAGMVGELTFKRLSAYGLQEKIIGFAVSKKVKNNDEDSRFCGLLVYEITELEAYRKEALVIVATLSNLHEEIKNNLSVLFFENVLLVNKKLYESFERHYIADFQNKNNSTISKENKLKILFMASDNNRLSGAFLCMVELCGMLLKNGVDVLIVLPLFGTGEKLLIQKEIPYTFIASKDWAYEIAKDNEYPEKIKFMLGQLTNYKARKKLAALIKEQSVSLVHCNTTYTYIGAVAAKKCGIPFVWHLRENLENQGYRIFAYSKSIKLLEEADKIIAVSDYVKGLMKFKKKNLVTTVYDAVEIEEDKCKKRKIFNQKTVRMIQVGLIAPYKGQRELIDACRILKNKNIIDFHLLIVGKSKENYVNELKEFVKRYGLKDNISFWGPSEHVSELYVNSDISFMCGEKEAYGRVTIESQMAGCLVIGVNAGGTAELIRDGETGYLYEAGNSESLAEKIVTAVSTPELSERIAKTGQEYAHKTYTGERNLREIMNIYEDAVRRTI